MAAGFCNSASTRAWAGPASLSRACRTSAARTIVRGAAFTDAFAGSTLIVPKQPLLILDPGRGRRRVLLVHQAIAGRVAAT